jgi:hypothetical protein
MVGRYGLALVVVGVEDVSVDCQPLDDHLDVLTGAAGRLVADRLGVVDAVIGYRTAELAQLVPHPCSIASAITGRQRTGRGHGQMLPTPQYRELSEPGARELPAIGDARVRRITSTECGTT